MARGQGKRVLVVGALGAAALYRSTVFVPPPSVKSTRATQLSTAACAAALFGAENAHADEIGDAAAKLSKAAYPFMKEVPWNSYLYSTNPGSSDAVSWAKAIGKMIDMGAAMDTKLLKAGADAHHAAIGGLPASGVCSEAQLTAITAAIGRMIASVPESKTMDVYNSVLSQSDFEAINAGLGKAIASVPTSKAMDVYNAMSGLVGSSPVPNYLYSQVNPQDAQAAYNALLEFKDVVKAAR